MRTLSWAFSASARPFEGPPSRVSQMASLTFAGAICGSGSEVVFTLRRRPGMSDEDFKADADAMMADLSRLRQVLEAR